MDGLQILVIVVATIFWVIGVILWIAVGAVVNNPPNGSKWKLCYSCTVSSSARPELR